jgi:non-canonical poly(A) RNA polymerase PAPD5/7
MGKDITCVLCNLPRKWTDYGHVGTRQKSRKCDECCGIGKYAEALCCGCEKTRPKLHFANSQLKKSAQIRRCLVCQGTKKEEDLIVEPEVEFKMCGGCMKAKGRSAFTSDRWGDRDEKRRCKLCTNRDYKIAIEKDCACFVCDEMKGKADFSANSWKLGYEKPEFRICIDCTGKDITCKMCNLSRKWTDYSTRMKKQCDECCGVGNYRKIMCGGCMRKRPKVDFATTQARKSPSSKRRCLVCQGKQKEVDSEDEELNRHEVVEKEALGDGGWNQGGDGWVNLVKESEDERAEEEDAEFISAIHRGEFGGLDSDDDAYGYDAYGQTFDHPELDGLDDGLDGHYYGEVQPTRRASLNGSLGLPDEQDAEFLERADYERDSLSGDSHEDCELYGALHSQVFTFASTAGPDVSDLQNRAVIQKKVREAIGTLYPASRLEVFGSGATGLALKCADIDLVVMGVGPEPCAGGGGFSRNDREELVRMLRKIEKALRREKIVWKANVISTAKVPIIKMNAGRYAVDLTVGASNGLSAVQWIKDQVRDFAAMRPIILVLKKLLKVHHLDDASTGGCGGYLLVSLVVSHLRQSGEPGRSSNPNLGALLLGFLRRFGYDFDYTRMAVAAGRASGVLRAKELTVGPGAFGRRPMILAEDPQVSSSHRFFSLFSLFRFFSSSSPRVCRVLDDGTPCAMIIIAFLVLSVGLASCSMKRLDSVPSLSARRRPPDKPETRPPSSFLFLFILPPLTLAFALAGNRP